MRFPRVKAEGRSFYHCVSRVVDRRFIFQTAGHGSVEAERFVLLMRRPEAFSGVPVLTYTLMSNQFHLLCEVPQAQMLSEAELLERIQAGARQGFLPGPPGYQNCSRPLRCNLLERSQPAQVPLCARKVEHQNQAVQPWTGPTLSGFSAICESDRSAKILLPSGFSPDLPAHHLALPGSFLRDACRALFYRKLS